MTMFGRALATAAIVMTATPAMAAVGSSYTFSGTEGSDTFAGSYTLTTTASGIALGAFSGSFRGYVYDLSNTGLIALDDGRILIGGKLNDIDGHVDRTNDFFFGYFTPGTAPTVLRVLISSSAMASQNFALVVTPGSAAAAVPEPASWAMMMFGFGGLGYAMRRRHRTTTRIRFA